MKSKEDVIFYLDGMAKGLNYARRETELKMTSLEEVKDEIYNELQRVTLVISTIKEGKDWCENEK